MLPNVHFNYIVLIFNSFHLNKSNGISIHHGRKTDKNDHFQWLMITPGIAKSFLLRQDTHKWVVEESLPIFAI